MTQPPVSDFTFYPLLWLSVCFAAGISAASFFEFDWRFGAAFCCVAAAVFSGVFIEKKIALIFLSIAFVAVGGLYYQIENQSIPAHRIKVFYDENRIVSGDPIEIEGVLQAKPELAAGGFFLLLKTEKAIYKNSEIKVSGNVRLFAPVPDAATKIEYEQINLIYGSRMRAACHLRRADDFLNPGVASRIRLLDQKQIDATGTIRSPLLIEKIEDVPVFPPFAWLYERRQNLIVEFRQHFSVSTAGVLIASLPGNGYFLDQATAEVFRDGGTFHVLVISGLHITFIGGLTLLIVQFFTRQRTAQFFIAAGFLWAFAIAVGADVPVVRAALMFTILLFSQVLNRSGTLLNSLGFCALILLIGRPGDLFTQSFQLTFASVAAIVVIAFPLVEKLRAVGVWSPSADLPFPPRVSMPLKRFCEMLYWREAVWVNGAARHLWAANLFKSPHLKWLDSRNLQSFAGFIFEALLISLIVQICLLPFAVVYFHRFSPIAVFTNLWVGIIIALESFAAIAAVSLAQINIIPALPLIKLTEILNYLLIAVPNFFTDNSWANWRVPTYSGAMQGIYVVYFLPVIFLAWWLNHWNPFALKSKSSTLNLKVFTNQSVRAASGILSLLVALIVFHPRSAPLPDGRLHIDFLDVGQGDAALIRFPSGETMLVDGGGSRKRNFNLVAADADAEAEAEIFEPDARSIGEAVVSQFLWEKGYSRIDYILATHADADHLQGLIAVAENFQIRAAIFGRTPFKNAEFAALNSELIKSGIESVIIARGDALTFGDVKIEVLNPAADSSPQAVSGNNTSLVLRVIYGERKFLLTGDIERETEAELLNAAEFLPTDVIKVAHHGSRTSSTADFVNAARAKVAVISVGRDSPYEHPHAEVVERWKNANAKVLTTGENGTISVSTDGSDLQLKTYNREKVYR